MVREADAAALVADVLLVLGQRGHDVKITAENGPRLIRLGALMLDAFDASGPVPGAPQVSSGGSGSAT